MALKTRAPGAGLSAEAVGRGPSGHAVRNELLVVLSAVTLRESAVASVGILPVQSVPARWALIVRGSAVPSGVLRGPTLLGAGRVSASRHVSIGTRTGRSPEVTSADTHCRVATPMTVPVVRRASPMVSERSFHAVTFAHTDLLGDRPCAVGARSPTNSTWSSATPTKRFSPRIQRATSGETSVLVAEHFGPVRPDTPRRGPSGASRWDCRSRNRHSKSAPTTPRRACRPPDHRRRRLRQRERRCCWMRSRPRYP